MTRQILNTGTAANDGTGDSLRQAGTKINANFQELYRTLGKNDSNVSASLSFDSDAIKFKGTSFTTSLGYVNPTANRSILVPNASGTVILSDGSQSLASKTLVVPTISDSSGNEILRFSQIASAANEITIVNSIAGSKPTISATGDDTNITLRMNAKGTGAIETSKSAVTPSVITTAGAVSASVGYIILNSPTDFTVTLNNGTTTGEMKSFSNRGAGIATITPASFAKFTSLRLPSKTGAQMIWDSAAWYLLGAADSATRI